MKVTYDPRRDTLHILFSNAPILESTRQGRSIIMDYDQHGHLVGLELAAASEQVTDPLVVDIVVGHSPDGAEAVALRGKSHPARGIA